MRRFRRIYLPMILIATVALFTSACTSIKPAATGWGGKIGEARDESDGESSGTKSVSAERETKKETSTGNSGFDAGVHTQLLDILSTELHDWMGTPHVWGGVGKSGVDCSGLIMTVYASTLGVHVPRTTAEMKKFGDRVQRSDLETGDLVFFTPDGDGRHVGIYMANNEFIHASSSRGVMRSRLTDPYWDRYYDTSRRVLTSDYQITSAIQYARTVQAVRSEITNR